jgi:hypothetical protein
MEVDRLPDILGYADEKNYVRIGIYLQSCASYLPEPEGAHCYRYRHRFFPPRRINAAAGR